VELTDVASGLPLGPPIRCPGSFLGPAALSADGTRLAVVPQDPGPEQGRVVRLWETATGRAGPASLSHRFPVKEVALSPDGRLALTVSWGQEGGRYLSEVRLWNTESGAPVGDPLPEDGWQPVGFSRDGGVFWTNGGNGVQLWDTATRQHVGEPLRFAGSGQASPATLLSPDGKALAIAGPRGTAVEIRVVEVATGRPLGPPVVIPVTLMSLAFSPDGRSLLTGGGRREAFGTGETRLWDVATGRPLGKALLNQPFGVSSVGFSPDGRLFLSTSGAGTEVRRTPTDVAGDPDRVGLWVQVLTGMELDPDGEARLLSPEAWEQRRRQLDERGGPPVP
jgi:WD40 repeat protein